MNDQLAANVSVLSLPSVKKVTDVVTSASPTRVKRKDVELPTFSGEDKTQFETWNASFTSVVDDRDTPVKEKVLRLQNCLRGKHWKL